MHTPSWTPSEDAIITEHYPKGGAKACQALLTGRTRRAIRSHAQRLELTFRGNRQVIHLDEERAITLYKEHRNMETVAAIMGVSDYAIERTMAKHNITVERGRAIDRHRDAVIADYLAGQLTNDQICTKYGVSRSELARARGRWGVTDPQRQRKLVANGLYQPNRKPMYACWVNNHGQTEADRRWALWVEDKRVQSSGSGNPMYGKPSPQGSGNGWKGWYGPHYFRSLREASFMIIMDQAGIAWQGGESIRIPYRFHDTDRTYRPDYLIESRIVVEIKPAKMHNTPMVQAKQEAAKAFCHERGLSYELVDIEIDPHAIYAAYQTGVIRFDRDYESRFLTYHGLPAVSKTDAQPAERIALETEPPSPPPPIVP